MISLFLAAASAFIFCVLGTPVLIKVLRARGIGQQIRDDGPFTHPHAAKAGTPTMGGLAIIAGLIAGYLVPHLRRDQVKFSSGGLLLVGLIVAMAFVGFLDDYMGVRWGRNLGLRKRGKIAGQLFIASGFALLALSWVNVATDLSFTRSLDITLGTRLWFLWAVLIIVSSANGVNITDGLDGLVAGSGTFVFAAFSVIAFWQFRHSDVYGMLPAQAVDVGIIAAAMVGACAGFLWWNAAPARIFMGDTGSLAIGTAMGGLALLLNTQLLLLVLGGLYVVETLSVFAQIISFRGFGKRILRMAPLHHHFEVRGWPEFTVIVRFWLFAGAFAGLALGLFYADFIRIPGAID